MFASSSWTEQEGWPRGLAAGPAVEATSEPSSSGVTRGSGAARGDQAEPGRPPVPEPRSARERPRLRVLVASGQTLVSETLREALNSRGFEVIPAPIPSGSRALRELGLSIAASRPSVGMVISDLAEPAETRDISRLVGGVPLRWLVVTSEPPGASWGAVLEAGAAAVLPMHASLDDLRRALLQLAMAREVMPPELFARVVREWHKIKDTEEDLAARLESLTPRENEVLRSLSEGLSVRDIAESVGVTEATVRSQVKSILRKLDVRSQLAGVAAYRQLGELRRRGRR